jgi:ribosomal protein L11 methyltransferase
MKTDRQVIVSCSGEFKEILMAEFAVIGYDSSQETDTGFITFSEEIINEELVEEIINRYQSQSGVSYTVKEVKKENWNKKWEESYDPIIVEDACIVRASFHPAQPNYPIDIIINPKMSFGTGHHETTYLMMKAQLDLAHSKKDILDAGTGTGILSILAGKLGARKLVAYDNDEWVIENVQENFKINETEGEILIGTVQELGFSEKFDIILANINKNVLLDDISSYAKLLCEGGSLLLSGFYEKDLDEIEHLATANDLRLVKTNARNDWAMAHFFAY